MDNPDLEILEYLVEYSDLLDDTTLELAEKILFDSSMEDLDTLEVEIYTARLQPLLSPECMGINSKGCVGKGTIEPEEALEGYQNGRMCCSDCLSADLMKKAS